MKPEEVWLSIYCAALAGLAADSVASGVLTIEAKRLADQGLFQFDQRFPRVPEAKDAG